ncbi:MAG TPA: DNA methyltransferase [Alphaproteobacteria bacterium]|nr:DNA methyltransferase [Alphaproteobacteria bacterium]
MHTIIRRSKSIRPAHSTKAPGPDAEHANDNRPGREDKVGRTRWTEHVVAWRPIEALRVNPRNARTHGEKQITQIAASIRRFGFTLPLLVDEAGLVIAGHARLEAARRLGWHEVPTLALAGFSEAEKRAYTLADNRLAETAGWDERILGEELRFLSEIDLDVEVSITGFETVEIDRLIDGLDGDLDPAADAPPPVERDTPPVSRLGDLWILGRHRLLCADALEPASYQKLLGDQTAQMVFTDPPYNVPIAGHVSGLGYTRHREFVMAAGELSAEAFTTFLTRALTNTRTAATDGAILYACMDWRHMGELLAAGRAARLEHKNLCVWVKDNGGMGSFYHSQHELVFVLKAGAAPHINNFGLGERGRYRTNVWSYPGVNTLRPGRMDELALHPTVKPVALVADAIRDCSHRGGVVLDPFGGSGTTLIAAERTGRVGCLLELDPGYVDVIIRRWEAYTGETARHGETGESFAARTRRRQDQGQAQAEERDVETVSQEGRDEQVI